MFIGWRQNPAMDNEENVRPDWRDLTAMIGETLLLWGFLETALRNRSAGLAVGQEKPGRATALGLWRTSPIPELSDEMESVATLRNLLAHGLISASVDPAHGVTPRVRCRDDSGTVHEITLDELNRLKRRIQLLRFAVEN